MDVFWKNTTITTENILSDVIAECLTFSFCIHYTITSIKFKSVHLPPPSPNPERSISTCNLRGITSSWINLNDSRKESFTVNCWVGKANVQTYTFHHMISIQQLLNDGTLSHSWMATEKNLADLPHPVALCADLPLSAFLKNDSEQPYSALPKVMHYILIMV